MLLFATRSVAQPLYRHSVGLNIYTDKIIPEFIHGPAFRTRERFVCNGLVYRYHMRNYLTAQAGIQILQRSVADKNRSSDWYGKMNGVEYTAGIRYMRGWKHLGYITGLDIQHLSYRLQSVIAGNAINFFYQSIDAQQKITSAVAISGIYIKPHSRISIEGETSFRWNFMHGEWDSGADRTIDLIWLSSVRICYNWGKH